MISMGTRFSNDWQWLDLKIGLQDIIISNNYQCDTPHSLNYFFLQIKCNIYRVPPLLLVVVGLNDLVYKFDIVRKSSSLSHIYIYNFTSFHNCNMSKRIKDETCSLYHYKFHFISPGYIDIDKSRPECCSTDVVTNITVIASLKFWWEYFKILFEF